MRGRTVTEMVACSGFSLRGRALPGLFLAFLLLGLPGRSAAQDVTPPTAAVLQPADGSYVNSLPAITGTAADDTAVASVTLALSRQADGFYWNGSSWSAGQTWLAASVFSSSWSYSGAPPLVDGSTYAVTARAYDTSGNLSPDVYSLFYKDASGCRWGLWSVQSGPWSSTATWNSGVVPSACSSVLVSAGSTVTLDVPLAQARTAALGGELSFARSASSSFMLSGGSLAVNSGGTLDMGTEASPIPASVTATLILSSGAYAGQYALVIEDGGSFSARGSERTPYAYATKSITTNSSLYVYGSTSAAGWQMGDAIAVGPTSGSGTVSVSTRTIFFLNPGAGPEYNVIWTGGALPFPRQLTPGTPILVVNLTRNVVVRSSGTIVGGLLGNSAQVIDRSASPAGFRAAYAEFSYLGSSDGPGYGLGLESASGAEISSSSIHDCSYGLVLNGSAGNVLYADSFYNNLYGGVALLDSQHNTLERDYAYGNGGHGLYLHGSSAYNTLERDGFYSNSGQGVYMDGPGGGNTLTGARVFSNGAYGTYVAGSPGSILGGNSYYSNASGGLFLGQVSGLLSSGDRAYSNYGPGLTVSGSSGSVFAGGWLGYDVSGASVPDAVSEVYLDPAMPGSLILEDSWVNASAPLSTDGFKAGNWLFSYGQNGSPGTLRLWGDYALAGSTLTLDRSARLYSSFATAPKLMRGGGHSLTGLTTDDASARSEIVTVKDEGGDLWRVYGSSSGVLGSFMAGPYSSYAFSGPGLSFTLNVGGSPAAGDALDFATASASDDAGLQKKLLFGPASSSFNNGRSKLEIAPSGGISLLGGADGSGYTVVDRLDPSSTYYTFVDSGAFTAEHSSFTNMDQDGIQLSGTGGISISSCSFDYLGYASGTSSYLTARDLTSDATFYSVYFGLSRSSAAYQNVYNVKVQGSDAGLRWHFLGDEAALGPLWGEGHDLEEGTDNKVLWGDVIPPSVWILQPSVQYASFVPDFSGTASDDNLVSSVTVSLNRFSDGLYWDGSTWGPGQAWLDASLFSSSWTYVSLPPFQEGFTYQMVARALDGAGNWSDPYSTATFRYDPNPPEAKVVSPADGVDITSSAFAGVSGTAWDAGSEPGAVWVKIERLSDGSFWDGAASQWTSSAAWNAAAGTTDWAYAGPPENELASWTSYYAVARAQDLAGNIQASEAWGSTFTYVVPPPLPGQTGKPSGLVLGVSSVAWSWAAAAVADGYDVYPSSALLSPPDYYPGPAFVQQGLSPNTTYSIMVAGRNFSGEGPLSPPSDVLTTLAAPPAGVSAGLYLSSVALSWALNGNPPGTQAEVERLYGSAVATTDVSYIDTGLLGCTSYYYSIWNVNNAGVPSARAELGPLLTGNPSPPQPVGLYAAALVGGRISISWEPSPFEGITAYNLYYDGGSGNIDYGTPLAVLSPLQDSYITGVLVSSAAYRFGLRAVHRCGVEEKNTSVEASAPSLPSLSGPRAGIRTPQAGRRVYGNSLTVLAALYSGTPQETRNVLFQYRAAGSGAWLDMVPAEPAEHPNPDASFPYFVHWDVTGLPAGEYELRAVAYGLSGAADQAPDSVTVDVDPAAPDITENDSGGTITRSQTVYSLVPNGASAGDPATPQVTYVLIPAGALDASSATLSVVSGPQALPPPPADAVPAGIAAEASLSGQSDLAGGLVALVTLSYQDADGDGVLDGTNIHANQLRMYSSRTPSGPWAMVADSSVDLTDRKVTGHTSHFSYFALFVPQSSGVSSARAYPVPWKPGSGGRFDSAFGSDGIVFDHLEAGSEISIFTVTSRLVRKLDVSASDLGVKVWDGKNSSGADVASGVYLAYIKAGGHSKVLKLAVER